MKQDEDKVVSFKTLKQIAIDYAMMYHSTLSTWVDRTSTSRPYTCNTCNEAQRKDYEMTFKERNKVIEEMMRVQREITRMRAMPNDMFI